MPDAPQIKVNGGGSKREAARLGQTIGDGVAAALAGRDRPLHIDMLRMQLPAGAGKAEIERAIRAAVERQAGVNRR
jgi:hypothetical protein